MKLVITLPQQGRAIRTETVLENWTGSVSSCSKSSFSLVIKMLTCPSHKGITLLVIQMLCGWLSRFSVWRQPVNFLRDQLGVAQLLENSCISGIAMAKDKSGQTTFPASQHPAQAICPSKAAGKYPLTGNQFPEQKYTMRWEVMTAAWAQALPQRQA